MLVKFHLVFVLVSVGQMNAAKAKVSANHPHSGIIVGKYVIYSDDGIRLADTRHSSSGLKRPQYHRRVNLLSQNAEIDR